jgi:hypothetical protein
MVILFCLCCLIAGIVAGWKIYDLLHPIEHSALVRASEVQRIIQELEKEAKS